MSQKTSQLCLYGHQLLTICLFQYRFREGVIATQPIMQRLTDFIWVGHSRVIDEAYIFHVAKIFYTLRLSLQSLHHYYLDFHSLPGGNSRTRLFPSINSYTIDEQTIHFEYLRPLKGKEPTCMIFLAKQLNPESNEENLIVVKFVERYGEQAHRVLAEEKLAPKLLYFGPLTSAEEGRSYGNLHMVVMEYIEGQPSNFTLCPNPINIEKCGSQSSEMPLQRVSGSR